MKKRYLVIFILTITILFTSFYVKQKKAEAVVPWVAWVALNVAVTLAVGTVLYFSEGGGNRKITGVNTETGQVDFDIFTNTGGGDLPIMVSTVNGKILYPVDDATRVLLDNMFPDYLWLNAPHTQGWVDHRFNEPDVDFGYRSTTEGARFPRNTGGDWIAQNFDPPFDVNPVSGGLGNEYTGTIDGENVEFYDFIEDVPQLPDCFDGIQNQDETGIDCGGVCEFNFGFVCPPAETCSDGIMNQDETGIDYGGVCGTGTPVSQPPASFTDNNQDGIDDISGLDSTGSIPVGTVSGSIGNADNSTYDASLPGDVSEVGETDWTGLITGYLVSNPLVLLATGSQINVTGATCSLPLTLFGKSMTIDFCSLDWMVDLFGSFVLGLMAIRAVFIAMGV